MENNYANQQGEDWKRFFSQYQKSSIDETGKVLEYSNSMDEMYCMFKARLQAEGMIK